MSNIVAVISLPACLWPNTNRNDFVEDNRSWIKRGAQRSVSPSHADFLALHPQYMSSKNDIAADSGDVLYAIVSIIIESASKKCPLWERQIDCKLQMGRQVITQTARCS